MQEILGCRACPVAQAVRESKVTLVMKVNLAFKESEAHRVNWDLMAYRARTDVQDCQDEGEV